MSNNPWRDAAGNPDAYADEVSSGAHRLTAANCKLAEGRGYPISSGNVCRICRDAELIAEVDQNQQASES
jgi:hypothetical protein